MNLHFPDLDPHPAYSGCRQPRRPVPAWALAILIVAILGGALVASSLEPDTRTFAQRHVFVPTGARAL